MDEASITWRKPQLHGGSLNYMEEASIAWRKPQLHGRSLNYMEEASIRCEMLLKLMLNLSCT